MTDMKVHMDWGGLFIVYFQKLIYPGQDSCDLNNCVFFISWETEPTGSIENMVSRYIRGQDSFDCGGVGFKNSSTLIFRLEIVGCCGKTVGIYLPLVNIPPGTFYSAV